MPARVVAIAGNICTGKSTLASNLRQAKSWPVLDEPSHSNRYLDLLRTDPGTWAFHTQVEFLVQRCAKFLEMTLTESEIVVSDRTIDEDFGVFCKLQNDLGFLTDAEVHTLGDLFNCLSELVPRPSAVIYLHCPLEILLARARGRSHIDTLVSERELSGLKAEYDRWIDGLQVPVLSLDTALVDIRSRESTGRAIDFIESIVDEAGRA